MTKCQSVSTFSSENLSVSDGEEGNTSDHSHSGTPDVVSTNTDERLDDKSDDLLSQGSEIPADPADPSDPADAVDPGQGSDGLSEKEAAIRHVRTQLNTEQNCYEVRHGTAGKTMATNQQSEGAADHLWHSVRRDSLRVVIISAIW